MSGALRRLIFHVVLIATLLDAAVALPARSGAATDFSAALSAWDLPRAQRALDRLKRRKHANVEAFSALLAFFAGDYPTAQAHVDAALRAQRNQPALFQTVAHHIRSAAMITKNFVERSDEHFTVRLAPGRDELLSPFIFETLNRIRASLAEDLGFGPKTRVLVEIYPDPQSLAAVSPLTVAEIERSGTIALCKYNRLMVVTPRVLLRGYPWRDTLAHEYVHLAIARLTNNNAAVWLQEGLAKHLEARWRQPQPTELAPSQRDLVAQALRKRALLPWSKMHPSLAKLPSQRATALAFAQAQLALRLIVKRGGNGALRAILRQVATGKDEWQAISKSLRLPQFDKAFRHFLSRLRLKSAPQLVPTQLQFANKKHSKEQRILAVKARRARRFFRIADMLRSRGYLGAAIVEYRKAHEISAGHDPLIASALTQSYLDTAQAVEAARTISAVADLYPHLAGPQVLLGLSLAGTPSERSSAAAPLRRAFAINPFDPRIACTLKDVLAAGAERTRYDVFCRQLKATAKP